MGKTDKKFLKWIKRREIRLLWKASLFTEEECKINLMKFKNYSNPQDAEEMRETNSFYYWQKLYFQHKLYKDEIRELVLNRIIN